MARSTRTKAKAGTKALAEEKRVIEANIKLHDFGADNFDNYPPWVMRDVQRHYDIGSKYARSLFEHKPLVLDAGCGCGGLALSLIRADCRVDINDISSAMVRLTLKKISRAQKKTHSTAKDVNVLLRDLARKKKKYDVICFAAMLHHIYDYKETMRLATKVLGPGGVVFICEEPQLVRKKKSFIARADVYIGGWLINIYKLFRNPAHAFRFIKNRFFGSKKDDKYIDVDLAEYHASRGIDELAIRKILFQGNMPTIQFETHRTGALRLFGLMDYLLRDEPKTFSLFAMKTK
ncbi:class I SAM-dependent methyltransferase [Candidatus Woesearchaeota archaeon]|nr:class I SAM-dependent methyltransferase [Candidatus Woesearchaeota archaeon]